MDRRAFLTASMVVSIGEFSSSAFAGDAQASTLPVQRTLVLVRSGFSREADGKQTSATGQQTVVRSGDSEKRLAAFVVPVGTHPPYHGAPLHLHHEQDEWIHVIAGEFVAEVGGERMRLKAGDSLLMPMRVPHRWSVAQDSHCGAIHLYTPAGLMDTEWAPVARSEDPKDLEARKTEFERHGLTLLGGQLSKEEMDRTL